MVFIEHILVKLDIIELKLMINEGFVRRADSLLGLILMVGSESSVSGTKVLWHVNKLLLNTVKSRKYAPPNVQL